MRPGSIALRLRRFKHVLTAEVVGKGVFVEFKKEVSEYDEGINIIEEAASKARLDSFTCTNKSVGDQIMIFIEI